MGTPEKVGLESNVRQEADSGPDLTEEPQSRDPSVEWLALYATPSPSI